MKTSELKGAALDWVVAKCEGASVHSPDWDNRYLDAYDYSTDWAQGGPIIEREVITLNWRGLWAARLVDGVWSLGNTPLEAAMRCYVASKLGDDIEIPEELI